MWCMRCLVGRLGGVLGVPCPVPGTFGPSLARQECLYTGAPALTHAPKSGPNRTAVASAFSQQERGLPNFHSGFGRCWAGPDSMTYAATTLDRRGTKFPRFYKTGPSFMGGGYSAQGC